MQPLAKKDFSFGISPFTEKYTNNKIQYIESTTAQASNKRKKPYSTSEYGLYANEFSKQ
jgi:hypothetical protein